MWSTGSKERASRPLGVLGSPPLAVCGSGAARLPPLLTATSVTSRGAWVPAPGCLAQRAHWAEPLLTTSGVLGSPPWLFVNLLATQEGTSNKASTGNLKTPTKQDQGMAVKTREVSSALPTQGLSCQRATCSLQVVCTRAGHMEGLGRAKKSRRGSATSGQPYPCRQWRHGSQGTKRPPKGQEAPHVYRLLQLGGGSSVSRQPRARICNRVGNKCASEAGL